MNVQNQPSHKKTPMPESPLNEVAGCRATNLFKNDSEAGVFLLLIVCNNSKHFTETASQMQSRIQAPNKQTLVRLDHL